jgi:hypothetical protein
MGLSVPQIRHAHVLANTCTNAALKGAHGYTITSQCANAATPYLIGVAMLVGGALVVLIALSLRARASRDERRAERKFRRDLKKGRITFDADRLDPTKNLGRFKLATELLPQETGPMPHDQKFLHPFPDESPAVLAEDSTPEVAEPEAQEAHEEG